MSPWSSAARRFQNRLLDVIGGADREPTIQHMLARDARESVAYWLQLGVSVGIATLGLALGSTAVVIAAMLVAPLMGPIVGLGMGLATSGPFLTLRATLRVASSVVVVVGGSALVTTLLPFHEVNAEIAARTVPTALDLITAAFCALAGVYAAVRTTSDTATTAAGTSIGISLVPPLCAAGYCIGIAQWSLALGALLLFVTNLVAIVLVGMLAFLALGFNQVPIARVEAEHLMRDGGERAVRAVARGLAGVYASSWGSWSRLLMPLVLLGAVYVPLRRALDEVTWQVEVRTGTRKLLEGVDAEIVASRVRVERHQVEATVVMIGTHAQASALQRVLAAALTDLSGVEPRVEVRAVPDAAAAAAVEPMLPLASAPAPVLPDPFVARLDAVHDDVIEALSSRWPSQSLGDVIEVEIDATAADLRLTVAHIGSPLDAATREILERALADALDVSVTVHDAALPAGPRLLDDSTASIALVAALVERSRGLANVRVCLYEPAIAPTPAPVEPTPPSVEPTPPEPPAVSPTEPTPSEPPAVSPTEPTPPPIEPTPTEPTPPPAAARAPGSALISGLLADHPRVTRMPGNGLAIAFTVAECAAVLPDPPAP